MACNILHLENGSDETDQSEDGKEKSKIANDSNASQQTLTQVEDLDPEAGKKGLDAGHGNRFQSKLLMLFAVRAINLEYQFYLGTELSVGEKFDDLIFHYKDENDTAFRQQYLQAKHILNENDPRKQITEANLLDVNNGNFSLLKYFQSYVKIVSKNNEIEHCIICTNVDFNHNDLKGITLELLKPENWPKLLDCKDEKKGQNCYKLKVPDNFKNALIGSIQKSINNSTGERIKILFKNCTEEVNGKQFKDHTADDMKIFFSNTQNQNRIEKLLERVFNEFLEKLIFAIKTPNESELDEILAKEVGKYFKLSNAALPSAYVMNEMANWFKRQENIWLTAKEAKDVLMGKSDELMALCRTTFLSVDYQDKLKRCVEFNDSAVERLTKELKKIWGNNPKKIMQVRSETPKLTAVKVISAIQNMSEFPNKDDYLVSSSKRLREDIKEFTNWLKVEKFHQLLVVVDEDAKSSQQDFLLYEILIPDYSTKRIILISNNDFSDRSIKDSITYEDLSETTKELIGRRLVSFQGTYLSVNSLIETSQTNEVLDSQSIENLLQMAETIWISSFSSSDLNQSLYIERILKILSKDQLLEKLAKDLGSKINEEIHIDSNGKIEWKIQDDKRKKEIWMKLKVLLEEDEEKEEEKDIPSTGDVKEEELIEIRDFSFKRIITGVAGTGKSTISSHYYESIKKLKVDHLVLKTKLNNYSKTLKEASNINDFLLNNVIDQNPFARSLLKHRLETGDRIILMLDGFDEIDSECQEKVILLVKNLNESIPLYITTRPHLADKLQFEFTQLAHSLVKFTPKDQTSYTTSIWKDYLKINTITCEEIILERFATQLIDRVSMTLNDKEKDFIGIPLQCRILAECFQSKIKDEIIKNPNADFSLLIGEGQEFDLASLYKLLMEEKRRVFRQEKIKVNSGDSHIVDGSIEKNLKKIELYLRKLAVQTIVYGQTNIDILIPSSSGFHSKSEISEEEKELNELGIRFGLLDEGDNKIQFLHRTYAEYFVADFIFQGFLLDEEKHNHLLENKSTRNWIIKNMLIDANGYYKGILVFLNSMFKEILINEQWNNIIKLRHLPDRFQQFTYNLLNDDKSSFTIKILEEESNITLFILDCLDKTFYENPSLILSVIINSLGMYNSSMFSQTVDVFARILHYFENADDEWKTKLLEKLHSGLCGNLMMKERVGSQNVKYFVQFMCKNLDQVKPIKKDYSVRSMIMFFILAKREELRQQMVEIVMSIYSDDSDLTYFMKLAIKTYLGQNDWDFFQIEKTIVTLKEKGKNEVAAELSRFVLFREWNKLQQEANANIRSSLEEMGMTGLHGAAFKGDLKIIEKEIGCSLDDPHPDNYPEEIRNSVLRLVVSDHPDRHNKDLFAEYNSDSDDSGSWIRDKVCYSPLYVAAAYGHEEICRKIFIFLPDPGKINNDKGFLRRALNDVMKCGIVLTFKTISKSVKAVWGQSAFVKLLQSVIEDRYWEEDCWKMIIKTVTDIVMQDKLVCYQDLNDLVFNNMVTLKMLQHLHSDILQGMITAAGGLENWIKRLMDIDIDGAFRVLSSVDFLHKLDKENHFSRLIDILITKRLTEDGTTDCYWTDFVKRNTMSWTKRDFLAATSKTVCKDDFKRLMFYREDNSIPLQDHISEKIFFLGPGEITDGKGFLGRTLLDAMKYGIVLMFETILIPVKAIWGQRVLIQLLKSVFNDYHSFDLQIKEALVDIVVKDDVNGYHDLNDLVFYNRETLEMLQHVEPDILQEMIAAAGGLENWIKRLMDTDVDEAFDVLKSDSFLDKLDKLNLRRK